MIIAGYRDSTIAVYDVVADEFGLSEGSNIVSKRMFFQILTANITAGKAALDLDRVIKSAPKEKESKVITFASSILYTIALVASWVSGIACGGHSMGAPEKMLSQGVNLMLLSVVCFIVATYLMVAR